MSKRVWRLRGWNPEGKPRHQLVQTLLLHIRNRLEAVISTVGAASDKLRAQSLRTLTWLCWWRMRCWLTQVYVSLRSSCSWHPLLLLAPAVDRVLSDCAGVTGVSEASVFLHLHWFWLAAADVPEWMDDAGRTATLGYTVNATTAWRCTKK